MSVVGALTQRRQSSARSVVRRLVAVLWLLALPSAVRAQEVIEYYGADHLGSIRVVFDATGNVVSRADYLPFGEEMSAPGPMPAEQFTGQARDGEAGLDYFNARQYQPRTGRFNALDSVFVGPQDPQQWNRYAYARNNPVALTDPSGMFTVDTNCRQSQGAYWCPGSIFIPNKFDPSSVDQLFDADAQGYQGGEALDMAEMGWGGATNGQFAERGESGRSSGTGKATVSTTTEGKLGNEVVFREGQQLDPMIVLALAVTQQAGALSDPSTYAKFYGASIAGAAVGLAVPRIAGIVRELGPSGELFGRGRLRQNVPGLLNQGSLRLGWYWKQGTGKNWFGVHWGRGSTGVPWRGHIPFFPGPRGPV